MTDDTESTPKKISRKDIDWQNNSEEYWRKLAGPLVLQMASDYMRRNPEATLTETLRNLIYHL